jgi:hypothetical protein
MAKLSFKLPKWGKIILWVLGGFAGLILIVGIGLKIWVSTWPEYRGDGFSLRYPQGWDVKDPRKDTNDAQFVYDAGSVLKIGDQTTNFPKDTDGAYRYKGFVLIYVFGNKASLTLFDKSNVMKTAYYDIVGHFVIGSLSFAK